MGLVLVHTLGVLVNCMYLILKKDGHVNFDKYVEYLYVWKHFYGQISMAKFQP